MAFVTLHNGSLVHGSNSDVDICSCILIWFNV